MIDALPLLLSALVTAGAGGDPIVDAARLMESRGAILAADQAYAVLGRERPYSADGHAAWARFLISEGRPERAAGPAGVVTRLDPYGAVGYAVLGEALVAAGQPARGAAMLDKALEMDPNSPDALLAIAGALKGGGDVAGSAALIARAVAVAGTDPRVREAAAQAALEAGRDEEAKRHLDALIAAVPGTAGAIRAAEVRIAAGRPERAVTPLQLALAMEPKNPRLLRALGRALLGSGAPPLAAAAAFREATRADGDDLDAHVGLGRALTLAKGRQGALDLARITLDGVLQRDPRHVGGLLARADLARTAGDPAKAEGYLLRVPESHAGWAEAQSLLALSRVDREDPYGAIDILAKALERRPGLRHVRLNLALAYLRAGRSADARREADTAIQGLPAGHPLLAAAAPYTTPAEAQR